jgi:hypothetical protein
VQRFPLAWYLLLPFLAACGGGGSTIAPMPQNGSAQVDTLRAAASDTLAPSPSASVAPSNDLLYVGNTGNNSITVYHHDAQGNTAPLYTIAGSKTQLSTPGQLSEDAQGDLYVADGHNFKLGVSTPPAVLVFAHGAHGNVAPIRKLNLPPGFVDIQAMTVDQITGKFFVLADAGNAQAGSVALRYAPGANGNAVPLARADAAFPAVQLGSDSTGINLIEAHTGNSPSGVGYGVETMVKQFPNNTAVSVKDEISWLGPAGLVDDPTTKTYLVSAPGVGIYRLAENTQGSGGGPGIDLNPAAVSLITSDTCAGQLSLGYLRNIYAIHNKAYQNCSTDAVYVYTHDTSGNATPLRILSGSATQLNAPFGLFEGK